MHRDAITPLVSFNYGMGNKKRVQDGVKYGLLYTTIIMVAGIVILQVFARLLVAVFGLSDETAELCVLAIRIISTGFLFAGVNIAIQGLFQALDCGLGSLAISALRLFLVVLPLAWVFAQMSNAAFIIWFAFPIAELVAVIAAILLMCRVNEKTIKKILTT